MSVESLPPVPDALPESHRNQLQFDRLKDSGADIDGDAFTLYDPSEIGLPRSGYYAVVGELRLDEGQNAAALVRERRDGQNYYHVLGLGHDEAGKSALNGRGFTLEQGNEVVLGRAEDAAYLWDESNSAISRRHLKISLFGDNIHVADTSTNGTELAGANRVYHQAQDEKSEEPHTHEYTLSANALLRLNTKARVEERGGETYLEGRVTVGRDTEINAERPAIDIRSWWVGGESIVIDSKKYPEQYEKLKQTYTETLRSINRGKLRGATEKMKLRAIYETVSSTMEYDLDYVKKIEAIMAKKPREGMRKVSLDSYLEDGKGVCRHMALAAAWLGGELARTGELQGKTTAGVNRRSSDNSAHEWARYTAADGTVYIIDPAQEHFGKLTDFADDKSKWEYFQPGEREKYEALTGKGNIDPAHIVFGAGRIIPRIWK